MVKGKDESRLMYIGDTYVKEGLFNGTVYIGGLPQNFDKFLKSSSPIL